MPVLCNQNECTGCSACANICPKSAIQMIENNEGFALPQIITNQCIECGLCVKTCPILNMAKKDGRRIKAYAGHNKNDDIVKHSSSGGVFTSLTEYIIELGGAVYGAAFQEDLSVIHRRVEKKEELVIFQGSKYVQSDIKQSYLQAKQDLESDRYVLFSGTPCQIAGLYSFLGKEYERLYCIDIICHSIPSPKAWQGYLQSIEKRDGEKVIRANFRDKREGWKGYFLCLELEDGGEIISVGNDNIYMRAFLNGLSTRSSCYSCKFKGENRYSDITLGDFWGVENTNPSAYHSMGTSLVFVNSVKGENIFKEIYSQIEIQPVTLEEATRYNSAYWVSSVPHFKREYFFNQIQKKDFCKCAEKLLLPTYRERIRTKIFSNRLANGLKRIAKR